MQYEIRIIFGKANRQVYFFFDVKKTIGLFLRKTQKSKNLKVWKNGSKKYTFSLTLRSIL